MFVIYRQFSREPLLSPDPVGRHGIFHTQDHPFCDYPNCRCHGQPALIYRLRTAYHAGLVSPADIQRIIRGETF